MLLLLPRSRLQALEAHRWQPFERLVAPVHFDAHRLEGGHPEQRLRVGLTEYDCCPYEFSHELYLSDGDTHADFATIGQLVHPLPLGREAYMDSRCCLGTRQSVAPVSTRNSPSQTLSGSAGFRMPTVTCIAPILYSPSISLRPGSARWSYGADERLAVTGVSFPNGSRTRTRRGCRPITFSFLNYRPPPQALESHGRRFLSLVERIDFDTEGLQGRYPAMGRCLRLRKEPCLPRFPHEFDWCNRTSPASHGPSTSRHWAG